MKRALLLLLTVLLITAFIGPNASLSAVDREQEIRDAVTAFVASRTTGMGWDVHVRRITIQNALKLPEGDFDYEVVASQQWPGWGNTNVSVLARRNDTLVRNIPVRVEVEALAETVVTLHQVEYGAIITAADLVMQKREITQNSHLAARTIEEVVGKKARTSIRANQPVRSDQIEKVPLVKSGQMVTIIAETTVLKVSVAGKANSSGAEGDIIRVQNLMSHKEIPARVIDSTTVQVAF
jgi:flagella basal body P-ring formation protein FlgA